MLKFLTLDLSGLAALISFLLEFSSLYINHHAVRKPKQLGWEAQAEEYHNSEQGILPVHKCQEHCGEGRQIYFLSQCLLQ